MSAATNKEWYKAQTQVRAWLNSAGVKTLAADYYAPFDLYTPNGTRIEVKWSPFTVKKESRQARQLWQFNIHRHGVFDNGKVDFYVLVCQMSKLTALFGMQVPIYLVIPAPINNPALLISLRSMLMKWGAYASNLDVLRAFDAQLIEDHRARTFEQAHPGHPNDGKPWSPRRRAAYTNGKGKQ